MMKKILLLVLSLMTLSSCAMIFLRRIEKNPLGMTTVEYSNFLRGVYQFQANDLIWKLDINEFDDSTNLLLGLGNLIIFDKKDSSSLTYKVIMPTNAVGGTSSFNVLDKPVNKIVPFFENAVYLGDSILLLNLIFYCDTLTNLQSEIELVEVKIKELDGSISGMYSQKRLSKREDNMLTNLYREQFFLRKKKEHLENKIKYDNYICFEPKFKNRIPYCLTFKKQYSYPSSYDD